MEGEGKVLKYVTKANFEDNVVVSPWSPLSFFCTFHYFSVYICSIGCFSYRL